MPNTQAARRRAQQLRRARGRRGGTDRGLACLVICGAIFVLLVAVKLLFPETAARLAGTAQRMISQNANFEEAFAAVGRMVSGEAPPSDALQDAYSAVFSPSEQPEEEPVENPLENPVDNPAGSAPAALNPLLTGVEKTEPTGSLLRSSVLALPEADKAVMRELVLSPGQTGMDPASQPASGPTPEEEPEEEPVDAAAVEASYVYAMPPLPENASLEQRNLGFEHCTPVEGRLTSTFGWREHPVEGGNKFHYGVDLGAGTGTDIVAFADGEVYATGESSSLGNYIMLRHEGGYVTLYGHCSRVTATGGTVAKGDKIAEVGATGLVTGPHLHFELHDGDLRLNPIYYVAVG